jgi:hypothetical protein
MNNYVLQYVTKFRIIDRRNPRICMFVNGKNKLDTIYYYLLDPSWKRFYKSVEKFIFDSICS